MITFREFMRDWLTKNGAKFNGDFTTQLRKLRKEWEDAYDPGPLAKRAADEVLTGDTLTVIKKLHRRGPVRPADLTKNDRSDQDAVAEHRMTDGRRARAARSFADESLDAIRKVHALGGRPVTTDFVGGGLQERERHKDPWSKATKKIRKCQQRRPFSMTEFFQVDGPQRLRKATVPLQSDNAHDDEEYATNTGADRNYRDVYTPNGQRARTGAANNFRDQPDTSPRPNRIPRRMPKDLSGMNQMRANLEVATDAIAEDLKEPRQSWVNM